MVTPPEDVLLFSVLEDELNPRELLLELLDDASAYATSYQLNDTATSDAEPELFVTPMRYQLPGTSSLSSL